MEDDEVKEENWKEQLCKDTEKHIAKILTDGISSSNLMNLSQLVDLQKDVSNIKYWEVKEMMYRDSGYGRRYRGDYEGDYGRRGVSGTGRGRYRGEDMIEDMRESYGTYMDGANSRYNGEADKSFKYMVKAMKDFYMHIMEEADSPEQKDMLRRTVQELSDV